MTVIRCAGTGGPGTRTRSSSPPGRRRCRPSWLEHEEETISVNYTSGTTGRPKGVQYTYRGAYLNALGEVIAAGLDAESRVPVDAADVPLQRLVLPVGGHRGRRRAT